ncbi:hypothetical protein M9Y10_039159 [Tritrichomonas musculus]|uniref:Dynein heavy chain family protein n=1 Tax=Tritrichomonas musculus TaxID=1915356 RepID=A0ABR2KAE6_9EUKA
MTDRFDKAKTQLLHTEDKIQSRRLQSRRLGKRLPEETIKIPKIGEWTLAPGIPTVSDLDSPQATPNYSQAQSYMPYKSPHQASKASNNVIAGSKVVKPFPQDKIPLNKEQQQRAKTASRERKMVIPPPSPNPLEDAPYHVKAPRLISDTKVVTQLSRYAYPPGTVTTDLNQIIRSKFRHQTEPLPPLKDGEDDNITQMEAANKLNIDLSNIPNDIDFTELTADTNVEPPFLPLEVFDDLTYEEYPVEELLKHPEAVSQYQLVDGSKIWKKCKVLGYNPENELFTIEWKDKLKKTKQVARFNIRFLIENEATFEKRLEAAKAARIRFITQFRFDHRVSLMPLDGLPSIDLHSIEHPKMAKVPPHHMPKDKKYRKLKLQTFEEAASLFKFMNNKLEFIYQLELNPLIPMRDEFLALLPKPKPVPEYGLVCKVNYNFRKILNQITENGLVANGNIMGGLRSIWKVFHGSLKSTFLLDGFPELLALKDFVDKQKEQLTDTAKIFKTTIQETLEGVISNTMCEFTAIGQQKSHDQFQKMMNVTSRMLHTVLLTIVDNTVNNYLKLFDHFLIEEGKIFLTPQFTLELTFSEEQRKLDLIPSIDVFNESVLSLLSLLEFTITDLPVVNLPIIDIETNTVSFEDCNDIIHVGRDKLVTTLNTLYSFLNKFLDDRRHLEYCLSLDSTHYPSEFDENGEKTLQEYKDKLSEFERVQNVVQNQTNPFYNIEAFQIHCEEFIETWTNHTMNLISNMLKRMKSFAISELKELEKEFNLINEELKKVPKTPEELASMRTYIQKIVDTTNDREKKLNYAVKRFEFLEEYKFDITDEDCRYKIESLQRPYKLSANLESTNHELEVEKVKMIRELRGNQKSLEDEIRELTETIPQLVIKYQDLEMTVDAAETVNDMQLQLQKIKEKQELYNFHDKLFSFEPTPSKTLSKLIEEFMPLYLLWNLSADWLTMNTQWLDTPFPQIKPDAMNTFMIQAGKKLSKLRKDLQPHPNLLEKVLAPLTEQIDKFKQHIPLISKLRHPGIKTKHWEKISEIVGFKVMPSMDLTLQNFLDLDLGRWNEQISEIAAVAANEYNIESSLDQMDAELQTQQFQTSEFRDTKQYILVAIDDLISLIDDQLVTTQTLLTSPFIAPVKKRAVEKLGFLRHCHDTLDAWVECQRGWLYLQPIFTGTSIQQKLFREARDWKTVDKMWTSVMTLTHNHPDFVNVMHRDHLLEDLQQSNVLLESITQGLNQYLEAKRLGFPRFFFLSNDELISILSHTKDFNHIQKSMQKLFEYIVSMDVDEESMITSMNDDGLEKVPFVTPVDGKTEEIEDWLNAFEEEMKNTLKEKIKEALPASSKKKREAWIADFPAQIILISNQIIWTQQVTNALKTPRGRGLTALQTKFVENLEQLTAQIRQPLSLSIRQVISCLLINEVHNRDIINSLIKDDVTDPDDFKWQVQLRYYWEDDTVMVRSINNAYEYSYEYAGNSARLVITPLTDRCYQTLLAAFKQNLSGAPSGPAGTGKTETVRDCAKALGRSCVVYNCSEEVTPEQMSQFFAGLASSGSWSCFDEFNRINIEVLSVIAQQVRSIQTAIAANVDTFQLDERTLKLNVNAAICITMNPGYAGRTELPDNLKTLFRPCAMMVPDFGFIAEIMLFSGGFTSASVLSVKLVALFDLCRKQLSHAHHYDWGLRAMKAILSTAGKLKRSHLEEVEALLLVQSITDCTRPRLVSVDVPLFDGIIHDVFPDVNYGKSISDALEKHMIKAFEHFHVQPLSNYLLKCNEVKETTVVRHGIMFVGGAMGGKSTSWKCLQMAMTTMAEEEKEGMGVRVFTLNPKSISIPELYGLFDPVTSGWSDGVLSSHIRDCSTSEPTEFKWIIVDGPVDSLWIETMNSLLDDNKVLCLSNNERISLSSHVKMMFEVDDLSQASPATVSRCGMIYFDPTSLPWTAIADSWLQIHNNEKEGKVVQFVREVCDLYVSDLIQFIEEDEKTAIGDNPMFIVKNMFTLLDCFLELLREPVHKPAMDGEDAKDIDPLQHDLFYSPFVKQKDEFGYITEDDIKVIFEPILIFCLVWSFGSVLNEASRPKFDQFLKEKMKNNQSSCQFPSLNTVYDYFFDLSSRHWAEWTDGKTGIEITEEKPIEQILVPTNETASMIFYSRLLIHNSHHVLFHGPESSKSLVIKTLCENILDKSYDCRNLPFANCSTASNVLKVFRSFLHKSHGSFGPLMNQHLVIFIDNIGSVKPEIYGAQPPLELIRQFFDYGGWYNTANVEFQNIVGTTIIAAMGPPGAGLFTIPDRLLRHFNFIHIPKFKEETLEIIVKSLLKLKLNEHVESVREMIQNTTEACLSIYQSCLQQLLPIPSKLHYIFSLRNIIRVIKGMLLVEPKEVKDEEQFVRLWYHEMMREFNDRFNQDQDRDWFEQTLKKTIKTKFNITTDFEPPKFNDFADRSGSYKECNMNDSDILKVCNDVLEDHNREATKPLDIVLFQEAVDHLSAMSRILAMTRGHALLVGVKSSGRKSLARLSLHMASMEIFEIQITRTYNMNEWREDMKNLMKQCGSNDLPTGFVISDVQIVGSFQLEDISNLMINGEIPNLFERDEMEQIKADIIQNELLTDEDPWVLFMSRVKKHLHIILVFSPYGSAFKESMLAFPSLRSEATIDWYMPWSKDALESVAHASLMKAKIGDEKTINSIVKVCVQIHKSVEEASSQFLAETKRFTACTPSRYFELLSTFMRKLNSKQKETAESVTKYDGGVEKITTTRGQIELLSQQLDRDIPMLQQKRKEVEEMLKELEVKRTEVEKTRSEVKSQSLLAEEEAKAAGETNRIAQEKLAAAQPILMQAQEAVDSMDRNSLVNIKTLKSIHPALRSTFEAICIIFNKQPRKVDSGTPGVKEDDYWPETLSLLNDIGFIKKVKNYEVEKMSKQTIDKLKKYVGANKQEREQKLAAVQSGYSAVANLYLWVCASYDYWFVYQEILPKKIEAEQAAAKLAESERILAERREHLQQVENQLKQLEDKFNDEKNHEKELSDNVANTQLRLSRAQKIMSGLSGETKRWGECATSLKDSSVFIMGDALLISGALTHLGAFSPPYRQKLITEWKSYLVAASIQHTTTFNISQSLGNDPMIREWIVKGLPNDTHSIENALIIHSSENTFPLLIDPQLSGTKWLRSEIGEQLVVLRFDQSDFLQRIKSAVAFGVPVLIENVGLKLDPLIEPILSRETLIVDGQKKIALGGEYIQYSDNFKMFLSTKYPNPHYSPEVCSQVILINFTTTQEGLSDLLMNNLIEVERDDLDKKRIQIMEANAANTKKLKEVEDEILQIVSNAGSDILEDDTAIETLQKAQKTSANIEQQMAASEKTEKQISLFREKFLPVAERASLLYFCASDFSVVDPMYQFSLKWFVGLFKLAIQQSEHPNDTDQLIQAFHISIARQFYQNVSFSLFSRHKLLFSTLMAIRILLSEKKILSAELAYLLSPTPSKEKNQTDWLPDEIWSLLRPLPDISPSFGKVLQTLKENENEWKKYFNSNQPENEIIPKSKKFSAFQKLIILRVFHLHRVREGLRLFVTESLGEEFVTPPPLNLTKIFKDSSPLSPLIFIITPGIDPQDEIIGVAQSMEVEKYLKSYSLGRGRGQGAEDLIDAAAEQGFWVLLQNCHLSLSWMPRLEHIIDNLDPEKTNSRFRLCLVTMSSPEFPIGILYQGAKLIYEIPKGIRENILRIYSGITNDEYNEVGEEERQLTFHLSFFHAVVLERLHFESIGWNIPYEFNPSDFAISKKHLKQFLSESTNGEVPFEALTYVIGELNYGGRVTDRWDRRLLLSLLRRFFSESIKSKDFSFGKNYDPPTPYMNLNELEEKVSTWPIVTEGEDVGLSKNASTITARNDALNIFNSLVEIQPTLVAASGNVSEEQFALNLVQSLIKQIPKQFSIHEFLKHFDITDTINTVLHHEILLYNNLLAVISNSLEKMEKGLKGLILIDESLELLNRRLLANKIPEMWLDHSFPSILTLRAYMDDLNQRVDFLQNWVNSRKRPVVFKLGAFYHPEEFLTAVLQVYARKHQTPFDSLRWKTNVVKEESKDIVKEPEEGIYVDNLFLEGAKWQKESNSLIECGQIELISTMPVMHLMPTKEEKPYDMNVTYECPLYRTQNRGSGALGLPNYIMSLFLPCDKILPDHWIQRSVAVFITVQS